MARLSLEEKAARVLERAKVRWFTRGAIGCGARDNKGNPTVPEAKDAVCWCAYGAIYKEALKYAPDDNSQIFVDIKRQAVTALGLAVDPKAANDAFIAVTGANDSKKLLRSHWNKAIRTLRKKAKEA
jgi:hypothetical protein